MSTKRFYSWAVVAGLGFILCSPTETVKEDLRQWKIDVAVIPGGLNTVLQPLDKFLNNQFKDNMRWQYLSWLTTGPFEFTPAGKKKAPSQNLVLHWIKKA